MGRGRRALRATDALEPEFDAIEQSESAGSSELVGERALPADQCGIDRCADEGPRAGISAESIGCVGRDPLVGISAESIGCAGEGPLPGISAESIERDRRVVGLVPERLIEPRNEIAVVGSDLEAGESRSYPLATVIACRPA